MNFSLYATLYSLVVVGFFVISLLVGIRQRSTTYKYFSIFAFLLGLWQLLQFAAQVIHDGTLSPLLLEFSVAVAAFMSLTFLLFALSYCEYRTRRYLYGGVVAAVAGASAFLSPGLKTADITREGISVGNIDVFYVVPLMFASFCVIAGLEVIFSHLRHSSNARRRNQDRTLLLAALLAGVVTFAFSVFYPGDHSTQIAIPAVCLVAVNLIAYSMIYHKLFDIRFFVVRAAMYLATLFAATVLFAAPMALLLSYYFGIHPDKGAFLLLVVVIVLMTYALQYMRTLIDRLTNKIFYRYYYDPQEVLDKLSDILVHTVDKDELCSKSSQVLKNAIRPDFVDYLLLSSHDKKQVKLARQLAEAAQSSNIVITDDLTVSQAASALEAANKAGIAIAVKLRTTHEDLGFIVMGHKHSGEVYTARDQRLLGIAADEIAIGLQNAIRFDEIEQFNITLQDKIEDATRHLRHSNAKLRMLDETKDDFISMASHQLRTPLTSVKGYVSMVLDGDAGKLNSLQRKLLNQAFVSSQRMVYLISDLLNVSRLRTGKFVIETAPINLANIIKEEAEQLKETAQARDLALVYTKPEHFPLYMLDETKMRQVIMNFMDNAIYYTPSGGKIQVTLVDRPTTIEFTVTDSGIGVPRADQPHLFTKFFRAHNARRARPDGTGLGLFMAKKVIIAQGGAIIFRSREGKGSTFGFSFAKDKLQQMSPPTEK